MDRYDKEYDFLRRDEWREEDFRNATFRRDLPRHLQERPPVRKPGELVVWLGSPQGSLQKLKDPCDPSQRQLLQVTWVTPYTGIQLNLANELFTWVTAYQGQDQPGGFDEESIARWARVHFVPK